MDDAVALALEQNLGIAVERFNPQIQDMSIAQARSHWLPTLTTGVQSVKQENPATNALAGGSSRINDNRLTTQVGMSQILPFGTSYTVAWNNQRSTTDNLFTNYNPLLNSNIAFNVSQPLFRNRTVDQYRNQLEITQKQRQASDVSVDATVVTTVRNVRTRTGTSPTPAKTSTPSSRRWTWRNARLPTTRSGSQIGTMAPIDIVEAQSEVARNEETVIVAESDIEQAEDRLRALIFDPKTPDFWTTVLEPTDVMPFRRMRWTWTPPCARRSTIAPMSSWRRTASSRAT